MSLEGLEKLELALQDSLTVGYDINVFIRGLLEAYVKLDKPTDGLINQTFFQDNVIIEDNRRQYVLISYAEKSDWTGMQKYLSGLKDSEKKYIKKTYIKAFYRNKDDYNSYRDPYQKIIDQIQN